MTRTRKIMLTVASIALLAAGVVAAQTTRPFQLNLTGAEYVAIESPTSANILYTSVNALRDGRDYLYQVPVSGAVINMTSLNSAVTLNPAGTLASLTLNFPPTKLDGRVASIFSSQPITALTLGSQSAGTTIINAPTSLPANQSYDFVYMAGANAWVRYE